MESTSHAMTHSLFLFVANDPCNWMNNLSKQPIMENFAICLQYINNILEYCKYLEKLKIGYGNASACFLKCRHKPKHS